MFDIIGYAFAAFAFITFPIAGIMWFTFSMWANLYATYMKEHISYYRLPEWISNFNSRIRREAVIIPFVITMMIQIIIMALAAADTYSDVGQYRFGNVSFHENLYRIYSFVCEMMSYPLGWIASILFAVFAVNYSLKFVAKVNAAMIKMK